MDDNQMKISIVRSSSSMVYRPMEIFQWATEHRLKDALKLSLWPMTTPRNAISIRDAVTVRVSNIAGSE